MIKRFNANLARLRRHRRNRSHLEGSTERPRLNIFRSGQHIYAQIIDDVTGTTLVAASSLDESLRDFKPAAPVAQTQASVEQDAPVEVAQEAAPAAKSKPAKAQAPAKGGQAQKGAKSNQAAPKTVLPAAQKGSTKTPVEALVAIANNRKVATAREVGKLVAQRAKEKGLNKVVFDRGGYAYHGRVAALAEGAREGGLSF